MVITERMKVYPLSTEKLKETVEMGRDEVLKSAYREMLEGCLRCPEKHVWYTLWAMELLDSENEVVGKLSFKGITEDGRVEIGYGIGEGYENKGYMTEAVGAVVEWAAGQPGVKQIEAEAERENIASVRVLEKCGFVASGEMGAEGMRFVWQG